DRDHQPARERPGGAGRARHADPRPALGGLRGRPRLHTPAPAVDRLHRLRAGADQREPPALPRRRRRPPPAARLQSRGLAAPPPPPRRPPACNPGARPRRSPLDGTASAPPIKSRPGAELARWTLDVNNDGRVDANDLAAPDGADASHSPNPNDFVLVRQVYG